MTYEGGQAEIDAFINQMWDDQVVPLMSKYIEIDCQSPAYDPEWATNGKLDKAMDLLEDWLTNVGLDEMTIKRSREQGYCPHLTAVVEGSDKSKNTVLLYGHMDKQPPLTDTWSEGLHPYKPVYRDGKLYGRAGADDGYSICAAAITLLACQKFKIPYARSVILIEGSEESGSPHLEYHINNTKDMIGDVDLIICLDSGALNYDHMWTTSSLRGLCKGNVEISLIKDAVHEGMYGGLVADVFRVQRIILDRLEDSTTGEVKVKELHVDIPADALEAAKSCDSQPNYPPTADVPLHDGCRLNDLSNGELCLRNTWQPTMTVVGVDYLPSTDNAGNVLRSKLKMCLNFRLPPSSDADKVKAAVKDTIERDPPYGAKITWEPTMVKAGWTAPPSKEWLVNSCNAASEANYNGKKTLPMGVGGSIPFMGMLGDMFPTSQFVITGVLGPASNAHGPDEFLHVPFGKKLNSCLVKIVADHHANTVKK